MFNSILGLSLYFNPRSLTGATVTDVTLEEVAELFQSTLPRGSDCVRLNSRPRLLHFNPRSLAGATIFSIACSPK